ncbi:MAG: monoheme cytochrome C [Bacteroidota bacterium]
MSDPQKKFGKGARRVYRILIVICTLALILAVFMYYSYERNGMGMDSKYSELPKKEESNSIGIKKDSLTGFVVATGMQETINNCTNCHSAQLVTQNRMTREGWLATIRWMQESQNLWELGDNEPIILEYLSTYYAPEEKGRRAPLRDIEWYLFED